MLKYAILILAALFSFSVVSADDKPACTTDEMITLVNQVAANFADGISSGQDPVQMFTEAQMQLYLVRGHCVPTPIIRDVSKGKGVLEIGRIPDGKYVFKIKSLFEPIVLTTPPDHDNNGCGIDADAELTFPEKTPTIYEMKDCDLALAYNTKFDWNFWLDPYVERSQ